MHRTDLLDKLARYRPRDRRDACAKDRIAEFVRANDRCFERSLAVGHITGAAWLIDRASTHVLLTHHRKLDRWLQLGGHCDGDSDVLAVALREAREESDIEAIRAVDGEIFDLDVHVIPAHGDEPEHVHYDVRFLCQTTETERYRVSDESHDLLWLSRDEADRFDLDVSVLAMLRKWPVGTGA